MSKIILIIAAILASKAALAAQDFEYAPGKKIKAAVSASNLNRIEFGNQGIAQVIGDDSKYKIIADDKAQNIFLIPKVAANQTLELAIVNFSGNVADLSLAVKEIEGQVIRIGRDKPASSPSTPRQLVRATAQEQEVAQMIKSMIAGKEGKYYVTTVKRKIDCLNNKGLAIEQDRLYRFGKLIGARLRVTNRKAGTLAHLAEEDFSQLFESCLAVSIERKKLPPKAKSLVWIVAKEQDHD